MSVVDEFTMQLNGFTKFTIDAGFPDVRSKFCKPKDIDLIFVAVNVEVNTKSEEDMMNPDRALMRFEFLDAIMRIAYRKFVMVSNWGCVVFDVFGSWNN